MKIGITYDLKDIYSPNEDQPDDIYEELDNRETVDAIRNALSDLDHSVSLIGGGEEAIISLLEEENLDIVFNISEGLNTRSREAHIPSVLELLNIPYTGSDPLALALSLDKGLTKRLVKEEGVSTPKYFVLKDIRDISPFIEVDLSYPMILKPLYGGSSIGIRKDSKVMDFDALVEKAHLLMGSYKSPVLIEEYIDGVDITVGILGNSRNSYPFGIMGVAPKNGGNADFIYSLEVKRNWREEVEYTLTPDIGNSLLNKIRGDAIKVFHLLGCRDVARVDFRVDLKKGIPYFLEINPLPGLNPKNSDLPIMASMRGLTYEVLIGEIFGNALLRYGLYDSRHNI